MLIYSSRKFFQTTCVAVLISVVACAEEPGSITTFEELCSLSTEEFLQFIEEDFSLERPSGIPISEAAHKCTEFAGDKYDPVFASQGYVRKLAMKSSKGITWCRQALEKNPDSDLMKYQLMRALRSKSPRSEEDAGEIFDLMSNLIDAEYSALLALAGLTILDFEAGRKLFEMDAETGLKMLEAAVQQENSAARRTLGLRLMRAGNTRAEHVRGQLLLIRAAEADDDVAQLTLGTMLFEQSSKTESDFQRFLEWVIRSAEGGNAKAMLLLYEIYTDDVHYFGRDDVPNRPNAKLAEKWILAALRSKSMLAYSTLSADFSGSKSAMKQQCSATISQFANELLQAADFVRQ